MLRARTMSGLAAVLLLASCTSREPLEPSSPPAQWWKGNLHTHSFWSDGDDYPEMIVDWYKSHGYDFIQLSDHNTLAAGDRWIKVEERGGTGVYETYLTRFGDQWVEERNGPEGPEVRLKTLEEYRTLFEEPGKFLVIQGEEISDAFESKPVHVNATNLVELIPPQGGSSVREVIENNVGAVLAQRERTGQPMFPHLNHPNFGWAVTAEDIIAVEDERFFEVYNGHPAVHNEGDATRPGTEKMWDIVLAERLSKGAPVIYGLAVDDSHNYHDEGPDRSNPGRGWVMVRAAELSVAAIIQAMEDGDFYATTGVELEDVRAADRRIDIRIRPIDGVTYRTQFIGTRAGYPAPTTLSQEDEAAPVQYLYPNEISTVLAESTGVEASYQLQGDELYVRAKIISSKPKANPYRAGDVEVAWTQPVVPGAGSR